MHCFLFCVPVFLHCFLFLNAVRRFVFGSIYEVPIMDLMNNTIREKLQIIPDDLVYNGEFFRLLLFTPQTMSRSHRTQKCKFAWITQKISNIFAGKSCVNCLLIVHLLPGSTHLGWGFSAKKKTVLFSRQPRCMFWQYPTIGT